MNTHYVKIAWRGLLKNRVSSFVNIGGLTVGIAVSMLIGLWIHDELSFDKYHKNYNRIAQVMTRGNDSKEGPFINNSLSYPLATELQTNYRHNFRHIIRGSWASDYILSAGDKKLSRVGQFMDAGAPAMLTLKMVHGTWSCLSDQNSIALSESTATALFGEKNPIGQFVAINNKTIVTVTGVYRDLPQNNRFSDIKFISPWKLFFSENKWIEERAINDWNNGFLKIYVEINPGTNFTNVRQNIRNAEMLKIKNLDKYSKRVERAPQLFLHPMKDWHLFPYKQGITDDKPVRMVWLVGTIGLFVLLLACINFMNLSTARSEKRAKEVGIRKTIGSMRYQLIYQFFGESFVAVIISFIVGFFLVVISLPWFNELAGKEMHMPWADHYFWLIAVGFVITISRITPKIL